MRKYFLVAAAILILFSPFIEAKPRSHARAQPRGLAYTYGAGIVVGYPFGLSGKLWISSRSAFDAVFAVVSPNEPYLHVTYLWHDFTAITAPGNGRLPFYFGIGPVVTSEKFGFRVPFGLEYIFNAHPFALFAELAPLFRLAPDFDLGLTAGIGVRYYWH